MIKRDFTVSNRKNVWEAAFTRGSRSYALSKNIIVSNQ